MRVKECSTTQGIDTERIERAFIAYCKDKGIDPTRQHRMCYLEGMAQGITTAKNVYQDEFTRKAMREWRHLTNPPQTDHGDTP